MTTGTARRVVGSALGKVEKRHDGVFQQAATHLRFLCCLLFNVFRPKSIMHEVDKKTVRNLCTAKGNGQLVAQWPKIASRLSFPACYIHSLS
jgi:hypothetical protein